MHIRAVVVIALLVLPEVASAQRVRVPRIGGRGPARPAPMPPQAPGVARDMAYAYRRLPLSIESYPLISHFQSSGFAADGGVSSWTSGGAGTRADIRVGRYVSATLDMTSSFLGGPAQTQTLEVGTRLRPERSERRAYPFMDLRVGYMNAFHSYFRPLARFDEFSPAPSLAGGARYSEGFGGVGGVGLEYVLTRTLSLTTAGSVMRARMRTHEYQGPRLGNDRFSMTAYRYMLGVRWNPVRLIQVPPTDLPSSTAARP